VDESIDPTRNKPNRAPNRRRDSPVDEGIDPSRAKPNRAPRYPPDEEPISPVRRTANRQKALLSPEESDEDSEVPIDEDLMPSRAAPVRRPNRKKSPKPANEEMISPIRVKGNRLPTSVDDFDDDDDDYYDPEDDGEQSDDSDIPKIVRGSILIKNAIDTTSGPKVIDVVEGDSEDDEFTVEDNTNLFHGQYYQQRENPLYSSQEDLRDMTDGEAPRRPRKKKQQPQFTEIFEKQTTSSSKAARIPNGYDNDVYDREIKVTRGQFSFLIHFSINMIIIFIGNKLVCLHLLCKGHLLRHLHVF
jgi:hypothetical protein